MQLGEIREDGAEVIEGVGPLGMPRQHDALPGREVEVNLPARFLQLLLHQADFLLQVDAQVVLLGVLPELIELALQLDDGLLEVQLMFHAVTA